MAQGQSTFDRVFPVSPDALYSATQGAVDALKSRKGKPKADDFAKSLDFTTKGTLSSHGHIWAVQALPDPSGARLHMTASTRWVQTGGTSDKWAAKVAALIFEDVSRRCAAASAV